MKRKKINKTRRSKLSELSTKIKDKLEKLGEIKKIDSNYVFDFGKFVNLFICDAIEEDPFYVEWCAQNDCFELDVHLQNYLDETLEKRSVKQADLNSKLDRLFPWD